MKRDRKIALQFLNQCGLKCDELPTEAWALFKHMPLKSYAKPLIINDRKSGKSIGKLAIKYGLSQRQIKYIVDDYNEKPTDSVTSTN